MNDAIGDFSIKLLKGMLKEDDEANRVFSAYSILTALGMVLYGARGS